MTTGGQGREYDLNQIYRDVFGHVRPPYPTVVLDSKTYGVSPVGTARALRGAFSFASKLGADYTFPTKLNRYQLPNEPTIRITGGKSIIETKITRLDPVGGLNKQNVLEEINQNNFRLVIRGLIINEEDPDNYPEEAVRRIREILTAAGSVSIDNALTNMWGITQLAIEDFQFDEVRGNIAVQSYQIIGYSDEYVNLEVVERA